MAVLRKDFSCGIFFFAKVNIICRLKDTINRFIVNCLECSIGVDSPISAEKLCERLNRCLTNGSVTCEAIAVYNRGFCLIAHISIEHIIGAFNFTDDIG